MKIYVIDDKREEHKRAEFAIVQNGHELGTIMSEIQDGVIDLAESSSLKEAHRNECDAYYEVEKKIYTAKAEGGGIITDMMFHMAAPLTENDPIPPCGLLVIIQAMTIGVPVVVCTNANEVGDHHSQQMHWFYDGFISPAQRRNSKLLSFGWVEDKNWDTAVKLLEQIHAQHGDK